MGDTDPGWIQALDDARGARFDPRVQERVGLLAHSMGRRPEAFKYLARALDLDPSRRQLLPKLQELASDHEEKRTVDRLQREPAAFKEIILDSFRYPVRGNGVWMLGLGAAFIAICRFLDQWVVLPVVSSPGLIATALMILFLLEVCRHATQGEDGLPDWPDAAEIQDFTHFAFGVALLLLVILLPLLLVWGFSTPASLRSGLIGAAVLGLVMLPYLPMGILASILFDSPVAALNVPFVLGSIRRTGSDYWICASLLIGIATSVAGVEAARLLPGWLHITGAIAAFQELYLGTVFMRLLGLFYRTNRGRLGWFSE